MKIAPDSIQSLIAEVVPATQASVIASRVAQLLEDDPTLIQESDGQSLIGGRGHRLYHISLAKLIVSLSGIIVPMLDSGHPPTIVALSVISALGALKGFARPLRADEAAVCLCLHEKGIPNGGKRSLPLAALMQGVQQVTGRDADIQSRVKDAIDTLEELQCVERDEEHQAIHLLDFFVLKARS